MCVCHALIGLARAGQAAAGSQFQRFDHQAATQGGQALVQGGGGVGRGNGQALGDQHVSGVQPCIHLHDGHARFGIARFNGAVNGGRSAPARQQRRVDVHAAQAWQVKHPLRQDQAVGCHHQHVQPGIQQGLVGQCGLVRVFAVQPEAVGLRHGNGMVQRPLFDRRGLQLHAASGGSIGLAQHQRHLEPRRMQRGQRGAGKFRRAGEAHAQRGHQ